MFGSILRKLIPERFRPIGYLTHLTRSRSGRKVLQGPFAGMAYGATSQGSAYIPKLLGIYERELSGVIETIVSLAPKRVIDIGAAEGYYAVGLARRLPETHVVAFEMEDHGRTALRKMAERNGVSSRVEVRGKCEITDLSSALTEPGETVIVCDVEGYEDILLDPVAVPGLRASALLVELHDFLVPRLRDNLRDRFSRTHEITVITQEPRSRDEFPWRTIGTRLFPASYLDWAISEWRPVAMEWFWMVPKADS